MIERASDNKEHASGNTEHASGDKVAVSSGRRMSERRIFHELTEVCLKRVGSLSRDLQQINAVAYPWRCVAFMANRYTHEDLK